MALGNILITCVPTPAGIVSSKFRDGNDAGASPPTDPQIGQPSVLNDDAVDIPLVTASTGGTPPLAYELSLSTTSAIAGFAVVDANADFTVDGVYSLTGRTASTQYWAKLACVDAASRRSGYSNTFTFTTPAAVGGDTTAPTAPANLQATSTVAGQAALTWTNGTDAVGIARTYILRGNSSGGVPTNDATVIGIVEGTGSSYQDATAPAGQEVFYRAYHGDAAGNVSAWTGRVFLTITAFTESKKFNPGHYVIVEMWSGEFDTQVERFAFYDTIAAESSIKGILLRSYHWSHFEGAAAGDYASGFALVDAEIAKLRSIGKRLILSILPNAFTVFTSSPVSYFPTYMQAAPYGLVRHATGWTFARWKAADMDRFIALMAAYGARYDSHPAMEMILAGAETTIGFNATYPAPAEWTADNELTQHIRLFAAMRDAWPTTVVMANTNWIKGGTTYMQQLFAALPQLRLGAGGPDQFPHPYVYPGGTSHNDAESDRVYTGEEGGINYRGVIPYMNQNQDPSYGGKEGSYLPSEIYAQNVLYQQTHHAWKKMWTRTDSTRFDRTDMTFADYVTATKWSTGILPYLRTNPAVTTTAPSALGAVVTGS